jgi:transcriptional regulator with XRE-family HTH domain
MSVQIAIDENFGSCDEDAVNLHIGRRLRRRRRIMGMTQAALAEALAVKFQQVQKYECAANRVSASRLYALAKALQTPVQYFFDGLAPYPGNSVAAPASADQWGSLESHDLLRAFYALPPASRQRLLAFVKSLSEEVQPCPDAANR